MRLFRSLTAAILAVAALVASARAGRPIVDLHRLDANFALFASDSNVPWKTTTVRLDTYSSARVDFAAYQVDPGDVLTAGSNARPRAIDTRRRRPVASFSFTPPGGYQFQSNVVPVPLGSREGFFVVEARRGGTGEQVWINRTRIGLLTKETPRDLTVYGVDLSSGRALAGMRVSFLSGASFVDRATDRHGLVRWDRSPRPIFALAQWGSSYAFTSLLPQVPLPSTIVGVRTDTAVVHAGDRVRVVGFARTQKGGSTFGSSRGTATISMRLGGVLAAQTVAPLDAAGAFVATLDVPSKAGSGDYAVLAQVGGAVGGATVHVDASSGGLTLDVSAACEPACEPSRPVPVTIAASKGGVPVRVVVVRSPHVFIGYTPEATAWGTAVWLDVRVTTDASGHASLNVPAPTDGLASTYGIEATSGAATADTRIVVPTGRAAVRLHLDRNEQTLGTPVNFDVYANDVASGKPLAADVAVHLRHGASSQAQVLHLDENGHAHGAFASPELGTSSIDATMSYQGAQAQDAAQIDVVPQAQREIADSGSADARVSADRNIYHEGEDASLNASLSGATGDVLMTFESASGAQTSIASLNGGRATARFRIADQPGALRAGAAFVRDGAIEWTSVPLELDAPGRPEYTALDVTGGSSPGSTAAIAMRDARAGAGTAIVRVTRGIPSGSALFDSAPSLLSVGAVATQVSAPAGQTWHPWVDSAGTHAQAIGFERRDTAPQELRVAQAQTLALSWDVVRDAGAPLTVKLPAVAGRYTISVLKAFDDGRIAAGSSTIVVQ